MQEPDHHRRVRHHQPRRDTGQWPFCRRRRQVLHECRPLRPHFSDYLGRARSVTLVRSNINVRVTTWLSTWARASAEP
ncbi:hypothetical protein Hsc_3233 [Herbaspirillum seropedicae]|nr:hypothetical protein Hsc_3233 [Herbaspirillum seropedicae]